MKAAILGHRAGVPLAQRKIDHVRKDRPVRSANGAGLPVRFLSPGPELADFLVTPAPQRPIPMGPAGGVKADRHVREWRRADPLDLDGEWPKALAWLFRPELSFEVVTPAKDSSVFIAGARVHHAERDPGDSGKIFTAIFVFLAHPFGHRNPSTVY